MENQTRTNSRNVISDGSNSNYGYVSSVANSITGYLLKLQEKRMDDIFMKYYLKDESASWYENYDNNNAKIKKNFDKLHKFVNSFFTECENIEILNYEFKKTLDKIIRDFKIVFASNQKLIDEAVKHLKFICNAYSDQLKAGGKVNSKLNIKSLLTDMSYFCENITFIESDLILYRKLNVEKDIEQHKLNMAHYDIKLSLLTCLYHSANMNCKTYNSFQQNYEDLKSEQSNIEHNLAASTKLILTDLENSKISFQFEFEKFDRDLKDSYQKLRDILKESKVLKDFLDHEARNMNKNLKLVHENSSTQQLISKVNEIEDKETKLQTVIDKLSYLEQKFDQKLNDSSKIFLALFVLVFIGFCYILLKF